MGVVVVEDPECDGRQDAGKVKEQRRRQDLLRGLDARQAVLVVGHVMRQSPGEILSNTLAEPAQLLVVLPPKNPKMKLATASKILAGGKVTTGQEKEQVETFREIKNPGATQLGKERFMRPFEMSKKLVVAAGRRRRTTYIVAVAVPGEPGGAPVIHPDAGQGLLFGQLLSVFQKNPLELIFGPGFEEPLAEIHVGQERGKSPARLQCILRPFLSTIRRRRREKEIALVNRHTGTQRQADFRKRRKKIKTQKEEREKQDGRGKINRKGALGRRQIPPD